MALDQRVLDMLAEHKADLASVTDAQARALLVAWARAWDEISVELNSAIDDLVRQAQRGTPMISRAVTVRQAGRSLRTASRMLGQLIDATGVRASADLVRVISMAAGDTELITRMQLPPSLRASVVRVDERQLEAIVRRTTEQITSTHRALSAEATEAMKRELVRTVAVGDNPRVAARRMLARSRGVFDGGRNRALTIARTEQLDAYRAATLASNKANADVVQGWTWIADLSARTCRSCIAMHGTVHPLDESGPIDHHQGRCTRATVTKSWAELGFTDMPEPKSLTPDADRWFRRLPESEQRAILTDRGWEQWKAGNYPRSSWSSRKSTEGWRDAQVPSIPPRSPADGS